MPTLNPDFDPMDPSSGSAFLDAGSSEPVTWGDRGRAIATGALTTGAQVASGMRAGQEAMDLGGSAELSKFFADALKLGASRTEEGMTPSAREQMHAALTSPEFWDHPISASVLKTLNMAPGVAAAVAPAVLTEGAITPWLVSGMGGVLGGAAGADDVYNQTDTMDDQAFQDAMPFYRELRAKGVPEDEARRDANTKLMGLKPLLNAAAGAIGMTLGPAGRLAGIIPEDIAAGLMSRVAIGTGEGALGGALMGGTGEATHEQTEMDLGKRSQLDPATILAAGGESALEMGAMGAVGGVFTGGHPSTREPYAKKPTSSAPVHQVDVLGPDAAQAAAMADSQTVKPSPVAEAETSPVTPVGNDMPPTVAAEVPRPAGEPVPPAPVPEPSMPTPAQVAASADDAGKTVPESPATLEAQRQQLIDGQRRAMLLPKVKNKEDMAAKSAFMKTMPEGMKMTVTKDGTFWYDPAQLKPKDIYAASKAGKLNEILDLGDYSKKDLVPKVLAGEPTVAVTERTPEGVEVKAAAGTTSTAPEQVASLEATKTPGNVVAVERPARVLQDRTAAIKEKAAALREQRQAENMPKPVTPEPVKPLEPSHSPHPELNELDGQTMAHIASQLENLWRVAEQQEAAGFPMKGGIEAFIERKRVELIARAKADAGMKEPTEAPAPRARTAAKNEGKKWTAAEREKRAADNDAAAEVVAQFVPHPDEQAFLRGKGMGKSMARDAIIERAKAMVEAAEKRGIAIRKKLADSQDKSMEPSSAMALLTEAKSLIAPRKKGVSDEHVLNFLTREPQLRSGEAADRARVLSERRAEGDQKMSSRSKRSVEDVADPEAEIAAERARLEDIPEEVAEEPHAAEPEDDYVRQEPAAPKEREPVQLKGDEVVAGKDKAGTFKMEVKQKPRRRPANAAENSFEHPAVAASALRLEKALEGKTVHEVADHLVNTAPRMADRTIARRVAKVLRRLEASGVKFEFKVVHVGDMIPRALMNARGLSEWNVTSRKSTVWINGTDVRGKEGMTHQTLLHELLHATTQQALYAGKFGKGDFVAKQLHRDLIKLGDAVIAAFNKKADAYKSGDMGAFNDFEKQVYNGLNNAFRNEDEILAWGMTNPHMQDFMESVPYKSGNIFSEFVDSIRRFLGLNPRENTALSELIRITENIFEVSDAEVAHHLSEISSAHGWVSNAHEAGDFAQSGKDINDLFHEPFQAALGRGKESAAQFVGHVTSPGKMIASTIRSAKGTGGALRKAILAVTTNDQYRQQIHHLVPMAKEIFDNTERAGVLANKLKEDGLDITGAMIRAQKSNPGLFAKFAELINDQTMVGADASSPLGEGRNAHLTLSKAIQDKLDKGEALDDLVHDAAMRSWEGRNAHAQLVQRYLDITRQDPQYKALQASLFDYYERAQSEIVRGQIDNILRTYDFKGTDAERAAAAAQIYGGKMSPEARADLVAKLTSEGHNGEQAVKQIENTQSLKVVNGPYAPQMRRGEHAIIGEYKVAEPTNGTKVADRKDTWEFKTRKEAHDFAVKTGLHTENKAVWYDTATGKRVKAKADAESTVGAPEQRFQVTVQRSHLEFHESARDAHERLAELEASGLLEKVGLEERRRIESEESQFTSRGVDGLLRSLAAQKAYQEASEHERGVMRHTIREAGLRSLSDNRVQARRLPRRFVQGASDDVTRNLYDYNNSQAAYRARLRYQPEIDAGLKAMWKHVTDQRYTPDNEARSIAANEVERRARSEDPSNYSGAYTEWTRRLSTWSYIDRMMRPSHLILHQTHLPMITAPYMAGRHGVMTAYGATLKAWKELTGFYGAGGHDAWATTWGSALQKGADYAELGKKAYAKSGDGQRIGQMLDHLGELGIIHPSAGIETQKYLPSKQMGGIIGGLDKGLNKVDTVFRHLTNATEAINRIGGATAAYRLEFSKLTRAGKSEAEAHTGAVEYARQTLTDTQGLYSATNAAPIFKNKFLKPFLQFKQFPQMMYHLLSKLVIQSFKGETRAEKVQAMASLAAILGMHSMMAGALQGIPLEPFKLLTLVSKGIGLTDSDWADVEAAERRSIKATLGEDAGELVINGLGSQLAGVDVHHRLGLNSFVTFGMPDQLDSKSVSEFLMNAVVGAPGSLVSDALKGTHEMLTGDVQKGALQAFPLQALRDVRNAVDPQPNKYGYEANGVDRVKSLLGFTPAEKAHMAERKNAVFNAVHEYDKERQSLTSKWLAASGDKRDEIWQDIQSWNASQHGDAKLTKGDLFKAMHRANRIGVGYNRTIGGVKTTPHNKSIAQATVDLYGP